MLSFIVPVKSKRVSRDWSSFCKLFEDTLRSICNQTDQEFEVVAVCHEIPEIDFTHKNVHFIQVDFEPPIKGETESNKSINKRREIDKGKKLKIGATYALEKFNTDYVMTVDSDDYISNRIAAHVNQSNGNVPGWYVKYGYIHMDGRKFFLSTRKFSHLCGSSVIVKPDLLKYFFEVDPILYFDHRLTNLNGSISLEPFPFYGGIYSIANGENHLMNTSNVQKYNNHKGWLSKKGLKRIIAKLSNYRFKFITSKLRKEYNFQH
jgi:glycosyltransferase involved in cell wall biosynthesis